MYRYVSLLACERDSIGDGDGRKRRRAEKAAAAQEADAPAEAAGEGRKRRKDREAGRLRAPLGAFSIRRWPCFAWIRWRKRRETAFFLMDMASKSMAVQLSLSCEVDGRGSLLFVGNRKLDVRGENRGHRSKRH